MAKQKYLHPFPARMAPSIALKAIKGLPFGAKVLDPMAGSGTVLRTAVISGYDAIGFDLDPLAVLMSKVWTTKIDADELIQAGHDVISYARNKKQEDIHLPWIDNDQETQDFIRYWYALKQRRDLRKLAYALHRMRSLKAKPDILDALKVSLSKIIITKKKGASLAWDISHSRPHKKKSDNDFDVIEEFISAVKNVASVLGNQHVLGKSKVSSGDARKLEAVKDGSIDIILTSPPYLNAIDYLRGHKFSLIWLGYTIAEIRDIRGISIGAEKMMLDDKTKLITELGFITHANNKLPSKTINFIKRYAVDACLFMEEASRVLKNNGKIVLVVGNSRIKGIYVSNSRIFVKAAALYGLKLKAKRTRVLPAGSRYLPISNDNKNSLDKRMKKEVILEFVKSGTRS